MAREKVLIVEDDPSIGNLIKINLEFEGYNAFLSQNGEEALIKAGAEKPDLILLDVMLPKMDGFEVLRNLKQSHETKEISVVMLTALGQEENVKKGYDLGAVDYISKPFSINRLLSAVETYTRKSKRTLTNDEPQAEKVVKVAIIGTGEKGGALLKLLQADPHFQIVGVSDLNIKSEGITLARKLNLPTYDEITFFVRQVHADCVFATDQTHYETIHTRILNINSQEIIGPIGLDVFLHTVHHLEEKEKVTRAVLREYKQVIE